MSTKALELLVRGFEKAPHGESTLPGRKCLHCVVEEAKKELEAIQARAAFHGARDYRQRLLRVFGETDALPRGMGVACAGAMKDLLIDLGMEWSQTAQDYVFPTPEAEG